MNQGLKGLTTEVVQICQLAGLPNVCSQYIGRKQIEEAMINHHLVEIRGEMEPLSKLEVIKNTDTRKMQEYMSQKSLENSRIEFLWETNMLETRYNMKGKYQKDQYQSRDFLPPDGLQCILRPEGGSAARGQPGGQGELPEEGHL